MVLEEVGREVGVYGWVGVMMMIIIIIIEITSLIPLHMDARPRIFRDIKHVASIVMMTIMQNLSVRFPRYQCFNCNAVRLL